MWTDTKHIEFPVFGAFGAGVKYTTCAKKSYDSGQESWLTFLLWRGLGGTLKLQQQQCQKNISLRCPKRQEVINGSFVYRSANFEFAPPYTAVAVASGRESVQCGQGYSLSLSVVRCVMKSNLLSLQGHMINVALWYLAMQQLWLWHTCEFICKYSFLHGSRNSWTVLTFVNVDPEVLSWQLASSQIITVLDCW